MRRVGWTIVFLAWLGAAVAYAVYLEGSGWDILLGWALVIGGIAWVLLESPLTKLARRIRR